MGLRTEIFIIGFFMLVPGPLPAQSYFTLDGEVQLQSSVNTWWVMGGDACWYIEDSGEGHLDMHHLRIATTSLILSPNVALSVSGELLNPHDVSGLVLLDDYGVAASLIHQSGGVEATMERFFPAVPDWGAGAATHWHLISSPVSGQAIGHFLSRPEAGEGYSDFYGWCNEDARWVNARQTDDFLAFNNGELFNAGQGYLVAYEEDRRLAFRGLLHAEDVVINGLSCGEDGRQAGWQLVGNPYAAAIDWDTPGWEKEGITGEVHVWDNGRGNYIFRHAGLGDFHGNIGAREGMFVQRIETDQVASLHIPAAARVHAGRVATKHRRGLPGNTLRVEVGTEGIGVHDAFFLRLLSDGKTTYDHRYDTQKISGAARSPQIYSHKGGLRLGSLSLPDQNMPAEVPVWFHPGKHDTFSLKVTGMDGVDPIYVVYLKDLHTEHIQCLREMSGYDFMHDDAAPDPRFLLSVSDASLGMPEVSPGHPQAHLFAYQGKIYVRLPEGDSGYLVIRDLHGRVLSRHPLPFGGLHEVAARLPAGVYLLSLASGGKLQHQKVMIQ